MSDTFPENDSADFTEFERPELFVNEINSPLPDFLNAGKTDELSVEIEPKRRKPKSSSTSLTKAVTRKVVSKTLEVHTAPAATRDMASAVLAVPNDTSEIVSAVFATKNSSGVFDDIEEIATSDPMEAAVVAASQGRERMKSVWKVLTIIGAANGAVLHTSDAKAGLAIARAAVAISAEQSVALADANDLLTVR